MCYVWFIFHFLLFYIIILKYEQIVSCPRGDRGFVYSTLDWLKFRSAYVLMFGVYDFPTIQKSPSTIGTKRKGRTQLQGTLMDRLQKEFRYGSYIWNTQQMTIGSAREWIKCNTISRSHGHLEEEYSLNFKVSKIYPMNCFPIPFWQLTKKKKKKEKRRVISNRGISDQWTLK